MNRLTRLKTVLEEYQQEFDFNFTKTEKARNEFMKYKNQCVKLAKLITETIEDIVKIEKQTK